MEGSIINKELLKLEIDKVRDEYLDLLYRIIKAFEIATPRVLSSFQRGSDTDADIGKINWNEFVANTYGSLSEAPIARCQQGTYEPREPME